VPADASRFQACGSRSPRHCNGRYGDSGEELAQEFRAQGTEAEFICADVRHDEEMRNLTDQTVERFGRLDRRVATILSRYLGLREKRAEIVC
jgi:hypothetical protein